MAYGGGTHELAVSDKFRLPRGTACGFHHTQNTPPNQSAGTSKCMGLDPAFGQCPNGWAVRSHFDMSSGGHGDCGNLQNLPQCGYFTWCEYQDPHGLCDGDPACMARARTNGWAFGVSSNTDNTGVESGGSLDTAPCPLGSTRTGSWDDGRERSKGISWCMPIADEPQGLTAYLQYVGNPQSLIHPPQLGFYWRFDGDVQNCAGCGFYHFDLASGGVTDPSRSDSFKLLPGTACGFHHTENSRGLTCMGLDPAEGKCPTGWIARSQFDMGSGKGNGPCGNWQNRQNCEYWAWCEYQDPHGLCAGSHSGECDSAARDIGYTAGISSNVDSAGTAGFDCPAGWSRSPFFDTGRPSGRGLSWCKH
jgi:hypothetical protein